jgi:hypothetical protein
MNPKEIVEAVLDLIGKDDDLTAAVASAIGVPEKEFGDVIDFVVIPELVCQGGPPKPQ